MGPRCMADALLASEPANLEGEANWLRRQRMSVYERPRRAANSIRAQMIHGYIVMVQSFDPPKGPDYDSGTSREAKISAS